MPAIGKHSLRLYGSMYTSAKSSRLSYVDLTAMIICNPGLVFPNAKDYIMAPPLNPYTAAERDYTIGDPTLTIKFKDFSSTIDCKQSFTYTFTLDNSDPLPAFVTVTNSAGKSGGG